LKISEELECAFGVVGKILMSRVYWNLFGKIVITLGPTAQATLVTDPQLLRVNFRSFLLSFIHRRFRSLHMHATTIMIMAVEMFLRVDEECQ
jgi:hypothetical protein